MPVKFVNIKEIKEFLMEWQARYFVEKTDCMISTAGK
jgi:hypothetical protein